MKQHVINQKNRVWLIAVVSIAMVSCATSGPKSVSKEHKPVRLYASQVDSVSLNEIPTSSQCPLANVFEQEKNYKKLMSYANACISKAQWTTVDTLGERMHQLDPDIPWGAYYMSVSAENRNHIERAQWMINLALKKGPQVGLLRYQNGRILWARKFYREAIQEIEKSIDNDSQIFDAYVFLGQIYLKDLNFTKSQNYFTKANSINSSNFSVIFGLSGVYIEQEKASEALSILSRGISLFPRSMDLRLQEAFVYENLTKQTDIALDKYKKIRDLKASNKLDGQITFDIGKKIKTLETSLSQRKLATK